MANIESPTQTPASAPTSVPGPTETPSAAQNIPLSDVDALSAYALTFLEKLTAEFSPRQSGTAQELAAAEFLRGHAIAAGETLPCRATN